MHLSLRHDMQTTLINFISLFSWTGFGVKKSIWYEEIVAVSTINLTTLLCVFFFSSFLFFVFLLLFFTFSHLFSFTSLYNYIISTIYSIYLTNLMFFIMNFPNFLHFVYIGCTYVVWVFVSWHNHYQVIKHKKLFYRKLNQMFHFM